jgi:hypothetical protein
MHPEQSYTEYSMTIVPVQRPASLSDLFSCFGWSRLKEGYYYEKSNSTNKNGIAHQEVQSDNTVPGFVQHFTCCTYCTSTLPGSPYYNNVNHIDSQLFLLYKK